MRARDLRFWHSWHSYILVRASWTSGTVIWLSDAKPVRCQKCGKPIGYVTVLAKGLTRFQQPIQNTKIVAICMKCFQKSK